MKNDCNHNRLYFGSGDYYIFCDECKRSWVISGDMDYPDPNSCVTGFYDERPRVKPGVIDELIRLPGDEV